MSAQTALNPRFFKPTVLQKTTGRGRRLIHKKPKTTLKTGPGAIWTNAVNDCRTTMPATVAARETTASTGSTEGIRNASMTQTGWPEAGSRNREAQHTSQALDSALDEKAEMSRVSDDFRKGRQQLLPIQ